MTTKYPEMLKNMLDAWIRAKAAESRAAEERRTIEDELIHLCHIDVNVEDTTRLEHEGIKVKVVGKLTRSVNADKLQEIAAENGITDQLSMLFRWKPEINTAVWKAAPEQVRSILSAAITTKPIRPTFIVTKKE